MSSGLSLTTIGHLGRQCMPKWHTTKVESVPAMAGITYLLVELVGIVAEPYVALDGSKWAPADHE